MNSVSFEQSQTYVTTRVQGQRFEAGVFLSNCDTESVALLGALAELVKSDRNVEVTLWFPISAPLEQLIDLHSMPSHGGKIDASAQAHFMKLREEALAMIAKIDTLQFG